MTCENKGDTPMVCMSEAEIQRAFERTQADLRRLDRRIARVFAQEQAEAAKKTKGKVSHPAWMSSHDAWKRKGIHASQR